MNAHSTDGKTVRLEQVISVGLVGAKGRMQELAIKHQPEPVAILRVTGVANGVTTIEGKGDNKRPTTYIKGAFNAENLVDNVKYISGQLILPDSASGYVVATMDEANEPMRLDMTIELHRSEKSIIGYKFIAMLHELVTVRSHNTPTPETDKSEPETTVTVKPDKKAGK